MRCHGECPLDSLISVDDAPYMRQTLLLCISKGEMARQGDRSAVSRLFTPLSGDMGILIVCIHGAS